MFTFSFFLNIAASLLFEELLQDGKRGILQKHNKVAALAKSTLHSAGSVCFLHVFEVLRMYSDNLN